ncbi:MAG TPA: alpha/beta fold hydrolase [Thermoanaerobaculia bacterium]|jgi:acetyl esterase/lipase
MRWATRATAFIVAAPLALVFLAIACGGMPPPPPAFYTPEARPGGEPGAIVRSEQMKGSPPGSKAWRVLYASTGLHGERVEVSGVIIAPDLPPPQGGRPVVAWAHPTTGISDHCAPSTNPEFFDTIPHLPALVSLDYVVAATDYEGLGTPGPHPYLVGASEGRSVLDSVRAAAQLKGTGAGPRFIPWGHSQGGHAALFAGQLARRYAPELALVGVAAIAPPTDLRQLLQDDFSERVGKILTAYALWSWAEVYGAPLGAAVPPSAIPGIEKVARDCIETENEGYRVGLDSFAMGGSFLVRGALDEEPWKRLLEENRPGAERIGAPIYVAQGTEDPVVRPPVTADFVRGLCGRGEVVRYEELPGAAHMRAARISATSAIQWMRDRFDGRTAPSTCSPPSP